MGEEAKKLMKIIETDIINRYTARLKKLKGLRYKFRRFLRAISLYTLPNGIFHKNEITYESSAAHIGTFIVLFLVSSFFLFKYSKLNTIKDLNTYDESL